MLQHRLHVKVIVVVVLVFCPWFKLHKVFSVFILMLHTRSSQGHSQLSTYVFSNAVNIHFLMCFLCVATYEKWDVINFSLLMCPLYVWQHMKDMMLSLRWISETIMNFILNFSLQSQDLYHSDINFDTTSF